MFSRISEAYCTTTACVCRHSKIYEMRSVLSIRMQKVGSFVLWICSLGCVLFIAQSSLVQGGHQGHLSDSVGRYVRHRSLFDVDPRLNFSNPRLRNAYIALQAWKQAILLDPLNVTGNWVGADVCSYEGIFCSKALEDPSIDVVAGIDLNHAYISGYLPEELGLLTDLALFHINTNIFLGAVPASFVNLGLLFELDLSNNRFTGPFPTMVLSLPSLKYLDIRFNEFEGPLPSELFDKDMDAIFLNNNKFQYEIPPSLGNSPASVLVLANNNLTGSLPPSIAKMSNTLNEILLHNNNLSGCLPSGIGQLEKLTVFDVSFNRLFGFLPRSMYQMVNLEQLSVAHNLLYGKIPAGVCILPTLMNFIFDNNFFFMEALSCSALRLRGVGVGDQGNCLPHRTDQRSPKICTELLQSLPSFDYCAFS